MSAPVTITLNAFTLATIRFSANYGEIKRPATAFIIRTGAFYFLVTALHVLTGRHWQTKALSDNGLIPNGFTLLVPFYKHLPPREHEIFWIPFEIRIQTEGRDEKVAPWLVHPTLREDVDVAILPLSDFPKRVHDNLVSRGKADNHYEIFSFDYNSAPKLRTAVGDDVFVVGFPENIKTAGEMPIWKRGSIASEPDIDIDDLPYLLVDTGTRSGMSGAPVLRRASAGIFPYGDGTNFGAFSKPRTELFGIYSGRFGADDLSSQLGIVWKEKVISEILATPTLGKSSICTRLW
jgi:hypothetical protein